ncbi:MAG: TonB-dependent receptor [Chitinophagales bacterium]
MKSIVCFAGLFLLSMQAWSQILFRGRVSDAISGNPLAGATIEASPLYTLLANDSGVFTYANVKAGKYKFRISNIGYRDLDTAVDITGTNAIDFRLKRMGLFMQAIEVRPLRADDKAPFTKTNLGKKTIEQNNLGQDLPFILAQTPSTVINSDAGNGVGYTGIYIRGTDATRINMTLNGIPYNDAESQGIYFVDLPDLASSVNSIQVQRGVGTSTNGAGAFGATINISTTEFNEKPYAEVNNSFGSFDTWKNTIKLGSGLIGGHFTLDARLSRIGSNGFIDRAASTLKSFYVSAAYINDKTSIRFNILSGTEKTYQAWNGIPEAKVNGDQAALETEYQDNIGVLYFTPQDSTNLFNSGKRTYNYFTYPNQTDNYRQDNYQLFINHQLNDFLSLNLTGFMTRGIGYYEEYKPQQEYSSYGLTGPIVGSDTISTTDLIRQKWLDNYFYGGLFSLQYKKSNTQLTIGGGGNGYDGQHYGYVIWAANGGVSNNYKYYNSPAYKSDFNFYAKWQQQFAMHWSLFADLQYRTIHYSLDGFDENPAIKINQQYQFLNPKLGFTYSGKDWQAYVSYALASHEPNRSDFEAGANELPKPETLGDLELGYQKRNGQNYWGATAYYMQYKDQLVLTGKINDVGSYTRTNIPDSYRLGIELEGGMKPISWFSATGNIALSQNKVLNYTEYIDDYDLGGQKVNTYQKTDIAFSPACVGAINLNFFPVKQFELSLLGKYVSQEYLDNTQNENRKLNGYYLQNLRIIYTLRSGIIKGSNLILQLNNVFNTNYEPNGYTYSYIYGGKLTTENFLFPMAGTNFILAVNLRIQ